ncbi:MAG TPA: transporter substrate-binding domain-containing protein [Acetobacteraceae bacterium]|nr:transporter substrate-binding domain-containing protein [Acetobacteraceae bacterium]
MTLRRPLLAAVPLLLAGLLCARTAQAKELPPLQTGVDATFAPHAFPKLGGGLQGFQIDLFNDVARRIHRKIIIHGGSFSGLIPALLAGRYDFLTAPVTVTPERAQAMIFTQGYLWTAYQFGTRKGTPPITGWADLKGRSVSVNKGTPYEQLADTYAKQYGFTVESFDTEPDAVQAVLSGHAYANLSGNTVVEYAAKKNPMFVAGLTLTDTKLPWATPFRKDEVPLRNEIDNVLKCMKKDGTIDRLAQKWFGVTPAPTDLENVIYPGNGIPGDPGYQPHNPPPDCSKYK